MFSHSMSLGSGAACTRTGLKPAALSGGLEPAIKAGLKTKPKELIEAYATGKAQYYGLYKRSFDGEDVHFDEKRPKAGESSSSEPSNSGSASPK